LCPPPRCQLVRSPALRRPALDFFGEVSGLCGRFVVRSSLMIVEVNLCDGVNGLYVFIAIKISLQTSKVSALRFVSALFFSRN
jgi:hypothetical protein